MEAVSTRLRSPVRSQVRPAGSLSVRAYERELVGFWRCDLWPWRRRVLDVVVLLTVGNMSWSRKSTYKPKKRGHDEQCDNPVEPVVAHGDKQPQEWEPPTSSQDIRPGDEKKDEGASSAQVGNIFRKVKSTYRLRKRSYDQACVNPVQPVVAHGDKQTQGWEPPTSSQDFRPGKAKEDEGAPAVEGEGKGTRNASCGDVCVCVCVCACVCMCMSHAC
nr:uncharacterized protein LOC116278377 [Vicugna pacos]